MPPNATQERHTPETLCLSPPTTLLKVYKEYSLMHIQTIQRIKTVIKLNR